MTLSNEPIAETRPQQRRIAMPLIGLVAAIAVVFAVMVAQSLANAASRGKQKRTMGDMRWIATAAESYSIDHNAYPATPGVVPVASLAPVLVPTYIKQLPQRDGWNNELLYDSTGRDYTLRSAGSDGRVDPNQAEGAQTDFPQDIIFSTGSFVAYPEGSMSN